MNLIVKIRKKIRRELNYRKSEKEYINYLRDEHPTVLEVLKFIKKHEGKAGIGLEDLYHKLRLSMNEVDNIVFKLLIDGMIYEPKPCYYKVLR